MKVEFHADNLGRALVGFTAALLGVAVVGAIVGITLQEILVFGTALGVGFALGVLFFDQG